jgi:hypothetical protein
MHLGKRYPMPVDDFALVRGATKAVSSKQEAKKVWEPKFIGEVIAGKDPRKAPAPLVPEGTTVTDFLDQYLERYVVAKGLRSVASIRSRLAALKDAIGELPVAALERAEAIETSSASTWDEINRRGQSHARYTATRHQLGARPHAACFHRDAIPPVRCEDQDEGRDEARPSDRPR